MKIATTVVRRAVRPVSSANAMAKQTGFVSGRSCVDNLGELDMERRVLAALAADLPLLERIPMLMSLDIKAAFPSVSRGWLGEAFAATYPL